MSRIECVCPPLPDGSERHPEGDTITLRGALDFRGATAVRNIIGLREDGDTQVDVLASITEAYLLYGIESWSVVNVEGKPVELTRDAIRARLAIHPLRFMPLGDEAHELYSEAVVLPLLQPVSTSSPDSRTGPSTSRTNGSSMSHPTPSRRSSTSTIPTDDTGPTTGPRAGDSSS